MSNSRSALVGGRAAASRQRLAQSLEREGVVCIIWIYVLAGDML